MSQTFKNLLAGAIVMTILLVAWGFETLRDRSSALVARLFLWLIAISVIALVVMLSMHFARAGESHRRYLVFEVHYGEGNVWFNKADAIALPARECARYAKPYSEDGARCYTAREFRALRSSPPTVAELRQSK